MLIRIAMIPLFQYAAFDIHVAKFRLERYLNLVYNDIIDGDDTEKEHKEIRNWHSNTCNASQLTKKEGAQ